MNGLSNRSHDRSRQGDGARWRSAWAFLWTRLRRKKFVSILDDFQPSLRDCNLAGVHWCRRGGSKTRCPLPWTGPKPTTVVGRSNSARAPPILDNSDDQPSRFDKLRAGSSEMQGLYALFSASR